MPIIFRECTTHSSVNSFKIFGTVWSYVIRYCFCMSAVSQTSHFFIAGFHKPAILFCPLLSFWLNSDLSLLMLLLCSVSLLSSLLLPINFLLITVLWDINRLIGEAFFVPISLRKLRLRSHQPFLGSNYAICVTFFIGSFILLPSRLKG